MEQRPGLSRRARRLLLHGDVEGRYTGRNGAEGGYRMTMALAVACSQPGREWSLAQFHEALVLRPTGGGSWVRAVRRLQGDAYLDTKLGEMLAKARRFVGASASITCRADALVELAEVRAAMENRPGQWAGTAGGVDLKNLTARLGRAQRAGEREHEGSVRSLAEEVGCARSTQEASDKRLQKKGWLVKLPSASGSGRWLVRIPPEASAVTVARPGQEGAKGARGARTVPSAREEVRFDSRALAAVMGHDAFHLWAHGASGARILASLDPLDGADVAALARATGLHRTTVSRRLGALVDDGLAVATDDGLFYLPVDLAAEAGIRADPQRLREVAQVRGTDGMGERRRLRHVRERELYRAWVTEREQGAEQNRSPDRPPLVLVPEGVIDPATGELVDERWRGDEGLVA